MPDRLRRAFALACPASVAALLGAFGAVVPIVVDAQPALADVSVTVAGHGWGHGRGMGQYGAQGYATGKADGTAWSAAQILDHFYGGTTAGSISTTQLIDVRLMAQDGRDLSITSGYPFNVPGIPVAVGAGQTVTIHRVAQNQFTAVVAASPCGTDYGPAQYIYPVDGLISSTIEPGNDINKMLTICNEDGVANNISYRGRLRVSDDGTAHTVNNVYMEDYLRGVVPRESPSGWSAAALQSQAVAARSYAAAEHRYTYAATCDTTACQVYGGAGKTTQYIEATSTDNAVAATAGIVRIMSDGTTVARTEFSSSTGGWTAGGVFSPVVDDGDVISPFHNWSSSLSGSTIASVYGVGQYRSLNVTQRNGLGADGGRVTQLQVIGSDKTVTVTGGQFQSAMGLRSDWFTPTNQPRLLTWYLRNTPSPGSADITPFTYGTVGDTPVRGDWNNGPVDGIGVFRDGNWYLRNTASPGWPDQTVSYGAPGYVPVVGRWANSKVGIGVFVNGNWYLRYSVSPGAPDLSFSYGTARDIPVVGDWNNDGTDTIGVYEDGVFYLRNTNTPGPPDLVVRYGMSGYTPLVGVWQPGPAQTIAVFTGGTWCLRYSNTEGWPDNQFNYGTSGYIPIAGNWSGGSVHGVGVVVPG